MSNPPPLDAADDTGSAKYVRLSRKLADRITAGEWADGRLPTVREIAVEYRVSSFTASRALHLLQEKGLVVTKERSGCFVAPPSKTVADRWALVLRGGNDTDAVRAGFERSAGTTNEYVPFPFGTDGTGPNDALAAVAGAGVRGVVFLPSATDETTVRDDESFVNGCRAAGLPVVLVERNVGGDGRPLAADVVAGGDASPSGVARWAMRVLCHRIEDPFGPPVRVTVC